MSCIDLRVRVYRDRLQREHVRGIRTDLGTYQVIGAYSGVGWTSCEALDSGAAAMTSGSSREACVEREKDFHRAVKGCIMGSQKARRTIFGAEEAEDRSLPGPQRLALIYV